jgi:hypothetical protein
VSTSSRSSTKYFVEPPRTQRPFKAATGITGVCDGNTWTGVGAGFARDASWIGREATLAVLQQRSDVLFEHGRVRCTHVFGVNASLSVDQERNGQAKDSPIC